jgi:tetratricopeptide (TPR) repeat protein
MKYATALIAILIVTFAASAQNTNNNYIPKNGRENIGSPVAGSTAVPATTVVSAAATYNAAGIKKHLEEKNYAEATALFRQAVKSDPTCDMCFYNLGRSLLDEGKTDEAVGVFNDLIARAPAFANGYAGLGDALTKKGAFEESISAYQKAAELAPNDDIVLANLGNSLFQVQRYKESLAALDRAVKLNPR